MRGASQSIPRRFCLPKSTLEGPDLPHITNEVERLLRPIVIQRLIRKHRVTEEEMRAFCRIMTCALT